MNYFNAIEWVTVRGDSAAVVALDKDYDEKQMQDLARQEVYIDGVRWQCTGVERFVHMPPWRQGEHVTLRVER